jgi:hypothetical protein
MPSRRKFQELEVLLTMRDRTRKVLQGTLKSMARLKRASFDAAKATAAIGGVSGAGFALAARQAGKYGLEIQTLSDQLNLTTDRFQELLRVAQLRQPATEAQDLAGALKDVVERITEARSIGEGDLFDAAQAVGLNLELTRSNEIIEDFIANMRQLDREDALFRLRELAGDEAYEQMFTFVSATNTELKDLKDTADRLGLIIDADTIDNLASMEKSLGIVKTLLSTIAIEGAGQVSAAIQKAALSFVSFVSANGGALPVLEKVWQRVIDKVNVFIRRLDDIPGVDIGFLGSQAQRNLAALDEQIADLENNTKGKVFGIEYKGPSDEDIARLDKLRKARALLVQTTVPAAAAFTNEGIDEELERFQELVERSLSTANAVKIPVRPKVAVEAAEAAEEVKKTIEPPATIAAKSAGEKAGKTFAEAFSEQMQNLQNTLQGVSGIFDGIEQLQSANDARAMDRLNAMRSRNAAELDILKTRLAAQQNLTRAEIGLHNQRAAAIAGNNAKIDQLAARAELQACKRAKKFAVIQGALSVAAAWAGAAKAGAAAAGGGPLAYFAAYAPVLSAGLAAAANIAKFNCNSIGSTSGGVGGVGGGTGGDGAGFNPTIRQGADLPSDQRGGTASRQPIIVNLEGDSFSAAQVQDLINQINNGDTMIDSRVVSGIF